SPAYDKLAGASHLVLVNGKVAVQKLEGITLRQLSEVDPKTLERLVPRLSDPLHKLNQSYAHSGLLLEIDTDEAQLLYIQHLFHGLKDNLVADHLVVWVKRGHHHLLEVL